MKAVLVTQPRLPKERSDAKAPESSGGDVVSTGGRQWMSQ